MLVVSRQRDESIVLADIDPKTGKVLGKLFEIKVVDIRGDKVRLGIEEFDEDGRPVVTTDGTPRNIFRGELFPKVLSEQQRAEQPQADQSDA